MALAVIWHIYSCLACSLDDSASDLQSSGKVVLGQGQVPCEFQADRPRFSFQENLSQGAEQPISPRFHEGGAQPAVPEVIWHICSHLYFSLRDGGRDLPSSGEAVSTMGQVPCEFRADRPNFIFQPTAPDVIWHIYLHLYCSLRDGGRDLPCSGEAVPTMGQVPCEFRGDWPNFIFPPVAPDMIWHIYSGRHCFKGVLGMDLLSSGDVAPNMGRSPVSFEEIGQTSFFSQWLLT